MKKWNHHSDTFKNFLSKYREIRPSDEVATKNIDKEKREILELISWFTYTKDAIRKALAAYVTHQIAQPPPDGELIAKINELTKKVMEGLEEVNSRC